MNNTNSIFTPFKKILPATLYLLAAAVIFLNIILIFDNVLWGDEAFSANMVRNSPYGMMQIIHFWDSHPPFYYFWLKICCELFGHHSYIYHLASLIPYIAGTLLALICFPKRFGHIPTAIFILFTGLSAECLIYNVEVRMYATATFFILCGFYASYLIIEYNRTSAWIAMVLCGLCSAYSHLYAFMIMGLIIFFTSCAVLLKHGLHIWRRGLLAHVCYILGYGPWFYHLYQTMGRMTSNWWMTAPATLRETVNMIFGGEATRKLLMPVLAIMIIAIILIECRHFKHLSTDMLFMLTGCATIACTFIVAYAVSHLYKPLLARRYVYPLTAVIAMLLVVTSSYLINHLKELKGIYLALAGVLLIIGTQNFLAFYTETMYQETRTQEVLTLIGDSPEYLISNGVQHLSWSVLGYYYPDAEIIETHHGAMTAPDFWYFKPTPMTAEEIASMTDRGYKYDEYLDMQFVKYPCAIYHFYQ